jgi:ATP-dependent Lon protease
VLALCENEGMENPLPPQLPDELPVLPLRRAVVFPLTVQQLAADRPVSIESINRALAADRMLFLTLQNNDAEDPQGGDMQPIGTVGIIRQMAKAPGGGVHVLVEGTARARGVFTRQGNTFTARVTALPEDTGDQSIEVDAYARTLREQVEHALRVISGFSQELRGIVMNIDDPLRLAYLLATLIDMKVEDKQKLLEEDRLLVKLQAVSAALTREISLLELKGKIESQAQQEMTDAQRQYYLRQQLKAIQEELGEKEGAELGDLRERIAQARLSEEANRVAERELGRLERMTPASPEYQMIRTYLDWILDVPWTTTTEDRLDPLEARKVLDDPLLHLVQVVVVLVQDPARFDRVETVLRGGGPRDVQDPVHVGADHLVLGRGGRHPLQPLHLAIGRLAGLLGESRLLHPLAQVGDLGAFLLAEFLLDGLELLPEEVLPLRGGTWRHHNLVRRRPNPVECRQLLPNGRT